MGLFMLCSYAKLGFVGYGKLPLHITKTSPPLVLQSFTLLYNVTCNYHCHCHILLLSWPLLQTAWLPPSSWRLLFVTIAFVMCVFLKRWSHHVISQACPVSLKVCNTISYFIASFVRPLGNIQDGFIAHPNHLSCIIYFLCGATQPG